MLVDYASLPETSKVFIYPSSRKFYEKELEELNSFLNDFLKNWKNLEEPLMTSYQIKYNRFIVITTNPKNGNTLNTLTIDVLVQFIIKLQERYNVILLDKMNACFKQGNFVQYKDLKEFKKLVKNKAVSTKTIVFDNLVQTKADFNEFWEIPITESWYARFLK